MRHKRFLFGCARCRAVLSFFLDALRGLLGTLWLDIQDAARLVTQLYTPAPAVLLRKTFWVGGTGRSAAALASHGAVGTLPACLLSILPM